jgi:hypothetical protein
MPEIKMLKLNLEGDAKQIIEKISGRKITRYPAM